MNEDEVFASLVGRTIVRVEEMADDDWDTPRADLLYLDDGRVIGVAAYNDWGCVSACFDERRVADIERCDACGRPRIAAYVRHTDGRNRNLPVGTPVVDCPRTEKIGKVGL